MDLGFEIRGFSCPRHRHRLSPKQPHATNFTKQVYQTNPIPISSDNAIAPASDNVLAPATGRPPPPVTQKTQPGPNRRKSNYQTDPIPKKQSKSTFYSHLPLTESQISPGPWQSKTTVARLEETRGFSWPAELVIPQFPRARQAP